MLRKSKNNLTETMPILIESKPTQKNPTQNPTVQHSKVNQKNRKRKENNIKHDDGPCHNNKKNKVT